MIGHRTRLRENDDLIGMKRPLFLFFYVNHSGDGNKNVGKQKV